MYLVLSWLLHYFPLEILHQVNKILNLIHLDLSLNCALAKNGYGEMGIAGSIAGPLFNLMIGLGITSLKKISANNW